MANQFQPDKYKKGREFSQEQITKMNEKTPRFCGAIKNNGDICRQAKGFMTTHPGEGRCKHHSGVANGSKVTRFEIPSIKERMEKYLYDTNIYDLSNEIALLRAYLELFDGYLKVFQSTTVGEILEGTVKIDVASLTSSINTITRNIAKIVETKHNIEVGRKYVIDIKQVNIIFGVIANIIDKTVQDIETREIINNELNRVLLPMASE
jgi:hypothetical protein